MKPLRDLFVLSALSANLLLAPLAMAQSPQPLIAADNDGSPSASDLQQSKDRGLIGLPTIPVASPPLNVSKSKPVVKTATQTTTKPVTKDKTAGHKPQKPVIQTAVSSTKSQKSSIQTAVSTAKTQPTMLTVSNDSGLVVKAWLNKSGDSPAYKVGEKLQVNVAPSQDCNLVVFDFDGSKTLTQIFPNKYQDSGAVKAGQTISIGGPDSPFDYDIAGKPGTEKIFIYAYPMGTSNPITVAFAPVSRGTFRSAPMSVKEYLSMVNNSKIFFARDIKVVPKNGAKPVSYDSSTAPNKIELPYLIK